MALTICASLGGRNTDRGQDIFSRGRNIKGRIWDTRFIIFFLFFFSPPPPFPLGIMISNEKSKETFLGILYAMLNWSTNSDIVVFERNKLWNELWREKLWNKSDRNLSLFKCNFFPSCFALKWNYFPTLLEFFRKFLNTNEGLHVLRGDSPKSSALNYS